MSPTMSCSTYLDAWLAAIILNDSQSYMRSALITGHYRLQFVVALLGSRHRAVLERDTLARFRGCNTVMTIYEQRLPGTGYWPLWGTHAILLVFCTSSLSM